MKIGDYVRTKHYGISKITDIYNEDKIELDNVNAFGIKGVCYMTENIIKSSQNIINLIKVGDILVIKDFVDEACMIFTDIYLIQNEQQLLNIKNDLEKNKNKKLYSIVTKEAFESMEYKIGDE